ncbi:uncharacterized protein LOC129650915 [Bubalus kerabau]|uniref:uncharacterized protein LOC129650915 n=1 Tax=Bubalus carabanensis TaxID=3119969 RepID=UPI00244E9AD8|nr:uncharacterized protein LOC129650915 [Bubalus carabanensis]
MGLVKKPRDTLSDLNKQISVSKRKARVLIQELLALLHTVQFFPWYFVITLSLCSCQDQECRGEALHSGPRFSCHLFRNNSPVLASRKTCCRCGKIYGVTSPGRHSRTEECHYHFGRVLSHKVLYSQRLELTRVAVVDPSLQVVYDTFVKPDEELIDYNTRFSGVAEDDLKNTKTSVRDVQAILLNLFSADTILSGHSFEHSLYALKLIHTSVVDTTVLFPHPLGLPHRRSLKGLVADYLQRVIQDEGHSSSENATACMELVFWKHGCVTEMSVGWPLCQK